jgi:hypothetical protein
MMWHASALLLLFYLVSVCSCEESMQLLREIRQRYVVKDLEFDRYSDHTNKLVSEGLRNGLIKGLRKGEHKNF